MKDVVAILILSLTVNGANSCYKSFHVTKLQMKKLIFTVLVLFGSLCRFNLQSQPTSDYSDETSFLCKILHDSIYSSLEGCPILLYTIGHYGCSWSLVTYNDSSFISFRGRYGHNMNHMERISFSQLDSTKFFDANEPLLEWGLDTIATQSLMMKPIKPEFYINVYEDLTLFSKDRKCVFKASDIDRFAGADSIDFNKKYHRLSLIMRWLAEPTFREIIPNEIIYE